MSTYPDPRHREVNCNAPFCGTCWHYIKGNIKAVMAVADELRLQPQTPTNEEGN